MINITLSTEGAVTVCSLFRLVGDAAGALLVGAAILVVVFGKKSPEKNDMNIFMYIQVDYICYSKSMHV